jgi:hypothetical protein
MKLEAVLTIPAIYQAVVGLGAPCSEFRC